MRTIAGASALLLGLLVAGCNGEVVGGGQRPSRLEVVSGDLQSGTVGEELAQALVVRVVDDSDKPIRNQLVNFVVTAGGGRVFAGSALTNAQGEARERWTLGTVAGDTQRVEARAVDPATGQPLVFAVFRAIGTADAPQAVAPVGAAVRAGGAGAALADSLAARVTDQYGNGVPGATVVWAVSSGGGAVSPAQSTTDAQGVARTQWSLGARVDGTQTAEASISPAVRASFTATAGLPMGSVLQKVSGDGQAGQVGGQLSTALAVRLVLPDGRPVQGASVVWNVNNGPGSGTVDRPVVVTDADGRADVRWTLGTAAGAQTLLPTVGTLSATFTASAAPGAPAALALVGGGGQTGAAGGALAEQLAVRVTDTHGNPVGGTQVLWGVLAGGGGVTAQSTADAAGIARATWTLGMRVDAQQRAEATIAGLRVEITAMPGIPSTAELAVVSGAGQSATVGTALAEPVVVMLRLADGRGIVGAPVTFSTTSGSGGITPATSVTDASGRVSATWTLGQQAGAASATAGAPGVASIALGATAASGAPASAELVSGAGQTGAAGAELGAPVVVRVLDSFGNPVPAAHVQWSVLRGGGSVAPAQPAGAGPGVAGVAWTLGLRVDSTHVLEAVVAPGIRVEVSATPGIPSSASLVAVSGDAQTGTVNAPLPSPVVVMLRLADGRGIIGAPVTVSAAAGSGSITPATSATDASGRVSVQWTLGQAVGARSATASAPGVASLGLTATAGSAAPATITVISGGGQAGSATVQLAEPLVVRLTDAYGNLVPGATLTWSGSKTGGFAPAQSTTDAQGRAETRWTPSQGGAQTVTATTANNLAAVFNFTIDWDPASVTVNPASGTVLVGDSITLTATVRSASGEELVGAPVQWTASDRGAVGVRQSGNTLVVTGLTAGYAPQPTDITVQATLEGVSGTAALGVRRPRLASLDDSGRCGLNAAGVAICPRFSTPGGAIDDLPFGLQQVTGILANLDQVCARVSSTAIKCNLGFRFGVSNHASTTGFARYGRLCDLNASGQAFCAGYNEYGQLGNGTVTRTNPRPFAGIGAVAGGHTFTRIASNELAPGSGGSHTCAIDASGAAWCWGSDDSGQLGTNAAIESGCGTTSPGVPCSPVPVAVQGGLSFSRITTGIRHSCAITTGGDAYCWGSNASGQLGTGNTAFAQTPVAVQAGGVKFSLIKAAAGENTTCALATDGRAFCWGGQLNSVPVLVPGGLAFKDLGVYQDEVSGLTTDGRLFRWDLGGTPTQVPGQI